jgi:hypothetical protein
MRLDTAGVLEDGSNDPDAPCQVTTAARKETIGHTTNSRTVASLFNGPDQGVRYWWGSSLPAYVVWAGAQGEDEQHWPLVTGNPA